MEIASRSPVELNIIPFGMIMHQAVTMALRQSSSPASMYVVLMYSHRRMDRMSEALLAQSLENYPRSPVKCTGRGLLPTAVQTVVASPGGRPSHVRNSMVWNAHCTIFKQGTHLVWIMLFTVPCRHPNYNLDPLSQCSV